MASERYGPTSKFEIVWLPDGSRLITYDDEVAASDVWEMKTEFEAAGGISIPVAYYHLYNHC